MTTISQIITEAYRESNNIAVGQVPTSAEQAEALNLFNRLLKSVFGNEAGDPFTIVSIGNNNITSTWYYNWPTIPNGWYPERNSRVIFNNTSAQTMALNPSPEDGERVAINDASGNFSTYPLTLLGNGRLIDGQTQVVFNTDNIVKEYLYRGDINTWMSVSDLSLTDSFPFPTEFEDFFIIGLAIRINPRNKQELDPQSVQEYKRLRTLFRARYSLTLPQRSEDGIVRTSGVKYPYYRNNYGLLNPNQRFYVGY